MSWRALEGLIDDSLAVIEAAGPSCDGRSLAASLFAFGDRHDTQFTRFRDMPRLIRLGYVSRLAPEAHPAADAALLAAWRAPGGLGADDLVWIGGADGPLPAPGEGTGSAYVAREAAGEPVRLYVEAGSTTWAALVAAGVLSGDAARPPEVRAPLALAVELAELAAAQGEGGLAADWYGLIPCELGDRSAAALRRDARVKRLRALAAPHADRVAGHARDVHEYLADEALATWWLAVGPAVPPAAPAPDAVDAALATLRDGRADLHEFPPTAGDYLQAQVYGPALAVLERAPAPPWDALAALVAPATSPSPWAALFAARVLRRQARAFYKLPDALARLDGLLDALGATLEDHHAYEDADEDGIAGHLLNLAARGGAKVHAHVAARAAAARARGERWDAAWRIAALAGGKAHDALWDRLAQDHRAATEASGGGAYDPALYDMLALELVIRDRLPVSPDWLAAVVGVERAGLEADAAEAPIGRNRLGFLARALAPSHPALAADLAATAG